MEEKREKREDNLSFHGWLIENGRDTEPGEKTSARLLPSLTRQIFAEPSGIFSVYKENAAVKWHPREPLGAQSDCCRSEISHARRD